MSESSLKPLHKSIVTIYVDEICWIFSVLPPTSILSATSSALCPGGLISRTHSAMPYALVPIALANRIHRGTGGAVHLCPLHYELRRGRSGVGSVCVMLDTLPSLIVVLNSYHMLVSKHLFT